MFLVLRPGFLCEAHLYISHIDLHKVVGNHIPISQKKWVDFTNFLRYEREILILRSGFAMGPTSNCLADGFFSW
jgi:hypothetical protein